MSKRFIMRIIPILIGVLVVLASCSSSGNNKRKKSLLVPTSSGNPYEVMVVAEDSLWDGYAGLALRDVLGKPMVGLPQDESMFHVSHIKYDHYDRITNLFRNIILLKTGNEFTMPKVKMVRDENSSPQLIMTIQAPDQVSLSSYITEQTSFIQRMFSAEEINRAADDLQYEHNIKFAKKVKEMFDCDFYIPTDIKKMKVGDHFIWASNDALTGIQNIVIYSYPYVSEKVFQKGVYIALRDSFMKRNIPGGKPNQYMATDKDFVFMKNISVQSSFAQEARGLWQMENDAMGGPFVSHSRVDTVNNRVIVVEGFVYAPEKMKRSMIRRLEAALYTLNLPKAKQPEAEDGKTKEK